MVLKSVCGMFRSHQFANNNIYFFGILMFTEQVQINALCRIRVTAVVRTPNGEGPQAPSLESATEDGDLF